MKLFMLSRFAILALLVSALQSTAWTSGPQNDLEHAKTQRSDQRTAAKVALSDFNLQIRLSSRDRELSNFKKELRVDLGFLDELSQPLDHHSDCIAACVKSCDDDNGNPNGGGSRACWNSCTKEGWSSSHCALTCGVSTGAGSEVCWGACTNEGWSSDHCASTCGVSTGAGSAGCWAACTKEGWSSDHCAMTCGVH